MVAVRTLVLAMVVLSAVAPGVALATADGSAAGATAAQSTLLASQTDGVEADDVLLAVDLRENGDAEWRIEYRIRLDDENTTQAFESLQRDVEATPENYTQPFRERMASTAAAAADATGREMAIENVSVSAETRQLPREYGVVTYRFTWTGFAAVDDSRIRAGDALAGLFLDGDTTLVISWPEAYQFQSADPPPDDRSETSASWSGPREFTGAQPSVVVATGSAVDGSDLLWPAVFALLVIVAILAGVAAVRYRSTGAIPGPFGPTGADGTGSESTTAEQTTAKSSEGETAQDAEEPATSEVGAEEAAADSGTAASQQVPDELLSNEERVLQLLDQHGGRMKQQQVVQQLDWTEAKTSQVVSTLRENDEIETFRIGRENVLALPEESDL